MPITHPAFKQIACVLMGAALFLIAGGHMALLQGIAWTTMVHDFSRTGSLSQAVEKTFDGHHLCPLCKKIAKERAAQEKAPLSVKAEKKAVVFVAHSGSELPFPTCRPLNYPSAPSVFSPERTDAPPVPVPIRPLA
jgi:hypothetical protein